MKRSGTLLIVLLCGAGLNGDTDNRAKDMTANPYQAIVVRNVFELRNPPPAPPPPTNAPVLPPSNVKLTGISALANFKRAFFQVVEPPAPGKAPGVQFVTLPEGAEKDSLRVLQIDEKAGSVKIVLSGIERVMTLKDDSPVVQPYAMVVAAPGMPGSPLPPGMALPVMQPGIPNPAGGQPTPFTVPRGTAPTAVTPMTSPTTVSAADINAQLNRIPSRTLRTKTAGVATPDQDYSQKVLLMELNRQVNQGKIDQGMMPPLPPPPPGLGAQ